MNDDLSTDLYMRAPLGERDGVPLFSQLDDYILNYETIAKDHLNHVETAGSSPFMDNAHIDAVHQKTVAFIEQVSDTPTSVLDVGVGLGGLIAPLDVAEKFGVDISMEYLAKAKTRGITVAMSKIEELPYTSGRFDLVTCTDVLEHVFDYMRCIFQIARVTKPGGTVMVRVPYKENLDVYRESPKYDFVHVRNFDLSELRLHFETLLGFEYLGHEMVGTAYRGWKTSVFEDLILNKEHMDGWNDIAAACGVARADDLVNLAHFEIEDVMNELSINAPEVFDKAVALLNRPVEICIAFRRPEEAQSLERSPLGQTHSNLFTHSAAPVAAPTPPNDISHLAGQINVLERQMRQMQRATHELSEVTGQAAQTAAANHNATAAKMTQSLSQIEQKVMAPSLPSRIKALLIKILKPGSNGS